MRILLVDDNPDALQVIEKFLKTLDHTVFAYTEGMEALLWLKEARPELAIIDLEMPNMDGFQFLKRLRGFQSYAEIPAICITGTDAADETILSAGFHSILRKPTTLAAMMSAIDKVSGNENVTEAKPEGLSPAPTLTTGEINIPFSMDPTPENEPIGDEEEEQQAPSDNPESVKLRITN
jgi:CheY-like chemotaxis protein